MKIGLPSFLAFVQDDSGQDLIEYALIAAVMALALIASMSSLTNSIGNLFNRVGTSF